MRPIIYVVLLALLVLMPVVSATYPNESNITIPIKFSFQGGQNFGDNPLEIFENGTGDVVFMGDTSSRNITLPPDKNYIVRVEPGGMTDSFNSPDAGLFGLMEYTEKNPLGVVIAVLAMALLIGATRRK